MSQKTGINNAIGFETSVFYTNKHFLHLPSYYDTRLNCFVQAALDLDNRYLYYIYHLRVLELKV